MADVTCYRAGDELFEFAATVTQAAAMMKAAGQDGTQDHFFHTLCTVKHDEPLNLDTSLALRVLRGIIVRLDTLDSPFMYVYYGMPSRRRRINPSFLDDLKALEVFLEQHRHERVVLWVRRGPPWGKPPCSTGVPPSKP